MIHLDQPFPHGPQAILLYGVVEDVLGGHQVVAPEVFGDVGSIEEERFDGGEILGL